MESKEYASEKYMAILMFLLLFTLQMKTVHTEYKSLMMTATVLLLALPEDKQHFYSVDEVVYFWIIDNIRNLMKRIKYTKLKFLDDTRNCSRFKFIEGYHVGGN